MSNAENVAAWNALVPGLYDEVMKFNATIHAAHETVYALFEPGSDHERLKPGIIEHVEAVFGSRLLIHTQEGLENLHGWIGCNLGMAADKMRRAD